MQHKQRACDGLCNDSGGCEDNQSEFPGLARSSRLDRAQAGHVGPRRKAAFSTAVVADALSLRRDV